MKNIVKKSLVLSALAIGMSSTVMAQLLFPIPLSQSQHGYTPVAYEINDGEKKATALLLLGDKGHVEGLFCVTGADQSGLGEDCLRVEGKAQQYDGLTAIELKGTKISPSQLLETKIHFLIPSPTSAEAPAAVAVMTTYSYVQQPANTPAYTVMTSSPTPIPVTYRKGRFITSNGACAYTPITPAGTGSKRKV